MQTRVNTFFELYDSDPLLHSGIKGQKWGRRRFQNPDGSLTPEGRERYGVGDYKPNGKLTRAAKKADRKMTNSLYRHFNMLESDRRLRENAEKQKKKLVSKGKDPAESKKLERRINKLNRNNESKQAQIDAIRQYMNEHGEERTVEALRKAARYSARIQASGGGYYSEAINKERLKRNLETANAMLYAAKRKSLAHSGIKGQRWGYRRYQNPDGTLTEEGKARYAYKREKLRFKEREANAKREHKLEMYKEKNRSSEQAAKNGGGKDGPKLFKDTKNFRNFLGNVVGISASAAVIYKGTKNFIGKHPGILAKPLALITRSDSGTVASILKERINPGK